MDDIQNKTQATDTTNVTTTGAVNQVTTTDPAASPQPVDPVPVQDSPADADTTVEVPAEQTEITNETVAVDADIPAPEADVADQVEVPEAPQQTPPDMPEPDYDEMFESMQSIDFAQFLGMGYQKIIETADKLEQSGNPEKIAIAQELRQVDPSLFELSIGEQKIKELESMLVQAGVDEDVVKNMLFDLLRTANERMIARVIESMNPATKQAWDELQVHEPNPAQQIYLLDHTAASLMKMTLDDIYEEELENLTNLVAGIFDTQGKSIEKVSSLTPEQTQQVKDAFDKNDHELGIQLIYQFAGSNGTK
ncbi:MAG: hypothetical protein QY318_00955 [Candidatus Dojkabacteria bacterium]|nr:MAG: hypothetical protein QY318_00955 [Candidatus Dojkabacteria bacterium]